MSAFNSETNRFATYLTGHSYPGAAEQVRAERDHCLTRLATTFHAEMRRLPAEQPVEGLREQFNSARTRVRDLFEGWLRSANH
jgi:hypothetical protein